MLLAAAVLWAGCSDGDKNADKTLEQEKVNTEQSLDVKKEDYEKARRDSVLETLKKIEKATKELEVELTGTTTLYGVVRSSSKGLERDKDGKFIIEKAKGFAKTPTFEELSLERGVYDDRVSFLRPIRQRTPGLRHIYNKHLKKSPSFSGTIVFRLNINADGTVQKVQIDSTTTGNRAFDEEIRKAVSRWNFPKKNSEDVATFPIRFYENEPMKLGD